MNKPLSIAATVILIRRYVEQEAKREQIAAMLGPPHTALAEQCVILYAFIHAAQEEREHTPDEIYAFTCMAVGDYLIEHAPNMTAWNYWSASLPQRVTAYTQHFEPVQVWLNEWPNIQEHIGLMQLEEHKPDMAKLDEVLTAKLRGLGIKKKERRQHTGNRPVTDEAIQWRLDAMAGWAQQWPDIETKILLLLPETADYLLSAMGGLVASTTAVAESFVELHRAERDLAAAQKEVEAAQKEVDHLPLITPLTA